MSPAAFSLTQKIETLTPEQLVKVEALVDSLQADDYHVAVAISEAAFTKVWDDPENDVYDAL